MQAQLTDSQMVILLHLFSFGLLVTKHVVKKGSGLFLSPHF